jgi:hypothetical protein
MHFTGIQFKCSFLFNNVSKQSCKSRCDCCRFPRCSDDRAVVSHSMACIICNLNSPLTLVIIRKKMKIQHSNYSNNIKHDFRKSNATSSVNEQNGRSRGVCIIVPSPEFRLRKSRSWNFRSMTACFPVL